MPPAGGDAALVLIVGIRIQWDAVIGLAGHRPQPAELALPGV